MPHIEPQVNLGFNRATLPPIITVDYHQLMVEHVDIGKVIKDALKRLGRTQGWLAEQMGVSDAAVSKWIKLGTIARDNVPHVADLLEIPASMLLSGKDDREELGEAAAATIRRQSRIDTLRRMFSALADEFGVELDEVLSGARQDAFEPYAPPLPVARPSMHEDRTAYAAESAPDHIDDQPLTLRHRERRS